ncbi:hypothetical protein UA08_01731 [Talaromyces atroroseus]|uniref:chitinase n=1 Tax=Talaromyces atroroseus TaxID=1441469 RepID=A0A1Q5QBY2_TALAT|nr:hypothetical protein UA08_01731 [Talaromyces atroroseus]OKL63328.1 hypothetical protein UA08_01731 [Talaromyces atroroseus]
MKLLGAGLAWSFTFQSSVVGFPTLQKRESNTATPRNVIYVQTFTDSAGNWFNLTDLVTEQSGITHVILASLHLDSPTQIHLNDNDINSTYWDPLWPMVTSLQSAGVKVSLMMGGAAAGSWARIATDFDVYYPEILSILRSHNLDGFDFDVEENVSLDALVKLAQQLDTDLGTDFILTGAPVATALVNEGNLDNVSWPLLDATATSSTRPNGKLFNWYNTQFYDGWGNAGTPTTYENIISAGWDPSRIVMGVLTAGREGSEWVSLSGLSSTISSLKSMYSDFGGISAWEYGGGAGSSDGVTPEQWVATISSYLFY